MEKLKEKLMKCNLVIQSFKRQLLIHILVPDLYFSKN